MGSGDVTSDVGGSKLPQPGGRGELGGWTADVELEEVTRIGNAGRRAHLLKLARWVRIPGRQLPTRESLRVGREPRDDNRAMPIDVPSHLQPIAGRVVKDFLDHVRGVVDGVGAQSNARALLRFRRRDPCHADHFLFLPGEANTGSPTDRSCPRPIPGSHREARWFLPIQTRRACAPAGSASAAPSATLPIKSGLSSFATQAMPAS